MRFLSPNSWLSEEVGLEPLAWTERWPLKALTLRALRPLRTAYPLGPESPQFAHLASVQRGPTTKERRYPALSCANGSLGTLLGTTRR